MSKPVLTTTRANRAQNVHLISRLATNLLAFLTPKAKADAAPLPAAGAVAEQEPATGPVAVPVPVVSPVHTPFSRTASALTLEAPVLPAEMFADEQPGNPSQQDEDDVPMWGLLEECTEAEGMMLHTAREWTKAQTDPFFRARLEGWHFLRYNVDWFLGGTFTLQDAVDGWGEENAHARYAAIQTVASIFPLFVPEGYYKKDATDSDRTMVTIPASATASEVSTVVALPGDDSGIDFMARNERERDLLDLFRHISNEEQSLLIRAALDAEGRTIGMEAGDDATTKHHRTLVEFSDWLGKVHDDQFLIPELRGNNLTENQNTRLTCAWEMIRGVFAEIETETQGGNSAA